MISNQSTPSILILVSLLIPIANSFLLQNNPPPTFLKNSKNEQTSKLQATSGASLDCRALGIGSAAPRTVITNVDLEAVVETSDEWIRTRTGISQRHVLVHSNTPHPVHGFEDGEDWMADETNESLKILGIKAAKNALEMSNVDPDDIDLVICATSSNEDLFGDATTISAALGCKNAFAFDLTAACSGFLFSIVTAGQFLDRGGKASGVSNALVVGADALTRFVDWDDRNSCILFGDAAGAMVLSSTSSDDDDDSTKSGILGYSMHSNGLGTKDLTCMMVPKKRPVKTRGDGVELSTAEYDFMTMNGKKVYAFATREVPKVLNEALDAANIDIEQVDWLLLHQANIRIMEVVAKRLGLPMEKVITNLSDYGNTSAASIPLALDEAVRSGKVKKGDVIACAGFGAGLSWGAAILRWG